MYIPVYKYPNLAIILHSPKAAHFSTRTCNTQHNKTPPSEAFPQCNFNWNIQSQSYLLRCPVFLNVLISVFTTILPLFFLLLPQNAIYHISIYKCYDCLSIKFNILFIIISVHLHTRTYGIYMHPSFCIQKSKLIFYWKYRITYLL